MNKAPRASRRALVCRFTLGFMVCLFGLAVAGESWAGVSQAWVKRYNGSGNNVDEAKAIAVDAAGNVYVTGNSMAANGKPDYITIKYRGSDGYPLWAKRYNGPANGKDYATALALDQQGNVYVTGFSEGATGYDYATIKYRSSDGYPLWTKRWGGTLAWTGHSAYANAIALDGAGNVYVTGAVSSKNGADYGTVKYSPTGTQLWAKTYNNPARNGDDGANALAVDAAGNVYVTGASEGTGGTDFDYATLKYSPSGTQLWVKRYNGYPGSTNPDWARAIAVDKSGNVYVTGESTGQKYFSEYATIKYRGSDGYPFWVRRYTAGGDSKAWSLAVDPQGNVIVTGQSISNSTYEYATVKYRSADGYRLWAKRYAGPLYGGDDIAKALAVDSTGNIYVTGFSGAEGTGKDYATIKYSPAGAQLWVARYNRANGEDKANALAVRGSNVYVTGTSQSNAYNYNSFDYATIKYTQTP